MSFPLPRFTDQQIHHDPLEIMLAKMETDRQEAIEAMQNGSTPLSDATDAHRLRGIPVMARGVGATQGGTNPATECVRHDHRLRRTLVA